MPTADWEKRVGALLRLEGLIKGGAAAHESFAEMLRPLKDALAVQVGWAAFLRVPVGISALPACLPAFLKNVISNMVSWQD